MNCERCGVDGTVHSCSWFNTEAICPECEAAEKAHPDYPLARESEAVHVANGNYDFPGIGLPADLKPERRKQ